MDAPLVTQRIAERHQRDPRAAAAHTRLASVMLGTDGVDAGFSINGGR